MISVSVVSRWIGLVLSGLVCAGCWNGSTNPLNEQKEAYFQRGRSLYASLDWAGALEAYEKALEVNPRNASAHFELCFLNEEKLNDYAAAIYHGERFLKLRPNSEFADVVRQHLARCKVELAKNMPVGPVTPALQRDFERVSAENRLLRQQMEQMAQQLALATNRAWQSPPPLGTALVSTVTAPPTNSGNRAPASTVVGARTPATRGEMKTHSVKERETLVQIAHKYGVSLTALLNANPGVEPRKLKVGQTIKVPAP